MKCPHECCCIPNDDALDELAHARKDLHARALVAAVADDHLARLADDHHFARVPQLALLLARQAKVVLEQAVLVKDLAKEHIVK